MGGAVSRSGEEGSCLESWGLRSRPGLRGAMASKPGPSPMGMRMRSSAFCLLGCWGCPAGHGHWGATALCGLLWSRGAGLTEGGRRAAEAEWYLGRPGKPSE